MLQKCVISNYIPVLTSFLLLEVFQQRSINPVDHAITDSELELKNDIMLGILGWNKGDETGGLWTKGLNFIEFDWKWLIYYRTN